MECPKVPIITVRDGGRTGNKIRQYATVWALSKKLNRPGFVPQATLDWLGPVFPNLGLPALEKIDHCNLTFQNNRTFDSVDPEKNILLPSNVNNYEVLLSYLDEIWDEFKFDDRLVSMVNNTIRSLGGEDHVVVGVHVRRDDYLIYLRQKGRQPVTHQYYLDAMQWFRRRLNEPLLFLIVSDDVKWCERHLLLAKDVKIAAHDTFHDLALLALADHVIIDYGSFGMWGAIMNKGLTVALKGTGKDALMAKYKKWHTLDSGKYKYQK
ncbi:galactoside 2-alpha-L-fucosyltransferase SEC1-like [Neocloeon triangulifer]|uniref:galactoside 2-alpha-L-fucosyltransferase SEC1-like n=1 Tax=Neocloeon triangulifer TaxID=2078957 RepID=UPI00286F0D3F|nr:galactoside 2-alpha-L-fucosyltransferase SEC1-like [Neocloeon triangulifer]